MGLSGREEKAFYVSCRWAFGPPKAMKIRGSKRFFERAMSFQLISDERSERLAMSDVWNRGLRKQQIRSG